MARNPDIEKKILANRDDAVSWAMYGDWLAAAGDVRGELVGLMLARESQPAARAALLQSERAFIEAHGEELLGPLLALSARGDAEQDALSSDEDLRPFAWYRGFLRELIIGETELFEAVLTHPAAAFVERVTLRPMGPWEGWLELLAGAQVPWRSVELEIDETEEPIELGALLEAAPYLEELTLRLGPGCAFELGETPAPRLRRLTLFDAEVPALNVEQFPALEELGTTMDEAEEGAFGSCHPTLVSCGDPDEDRDWLETAFVVTDTPVTPDQLRALIAPLSGIEQLTACFGSVRVGARTLTAIRFHGEGQLFPWSAARALQLASPRSAVASFLVSANAGVARSAGAGRGVVAASARFSEGGKLVRDTLDLLTGIDPGPSALPRFVDSLRTEPVALVGEPVRSYAFDDQLLTEIDPQSGPLEREESEFDEPPGDDLFAVLEENEGWQAQSVPIEEEAGTVAVLVEAPEEDEAVEAAGDQDQLEDQDEDDDDEPTEEGLPPEDVVWAEGPVDPDEDWEVLPGEDPLLEEIVRVNPDELESSPLCRRCRGQLDRVCSGCGNDCCGQCSLIRSQGGSDEVTCQTCLHG